MGALPDSYVVRQLVTEDRVAALPTGAGSAGSPAIAKPDQFCRFSRAHLGN